RVKSGSAACCAESLWLSGADSLPCSPRLGWKAQPSSRVEGVSQGGGPRKSEAFPHIRRQSRMGMLPLGDFDATRNARRGGLKCRGSLVHLRGTRLCLLPGVSFSCGGSRARGSSLVSISL